MMNFKLQTSRLNSQRQTNGKIIIIYGKMILFNPKAKKMRNLGSILFFD
jgi:hypothetical protein